MKLQMGLFRLNNDGANFITAFPLDTYHKIVMSNCPNKFIFIYYNSDKDKFYLENNLYIAKSIENNIDFAISPNGKTGAYLKNHCRVILFDTENLATKAEFKIKFSKYLAFDNENMILSCVGRNTITEIDLD